MCPKRFERVESFYISYVECPKCGVGGKLIAHLQRFGGKWCGPYYVVSHLRSVYDRDKYKGVRTGGLSSLQARDAAHHKAVYRGECYLGKRLPGDVEARLKDQLRRVQDFLCSEDDALRRQGKIKRALS